MNNVNASKNSKLRVPTTVELKAELPTKARIAPSFASPHWADVSNEAFDSEETHRE